MTEKNIQIKQHNGTDWDSLFPKTKASITLMDNGSTVENTIADILTTLGQKLTLSQVNAEIEKVVGSAPAALDTLKELADALNNDPDFATTITNALAKKVDKVSGKGLSTEDFTTALKSKLESLSNYNHPTGDGNLHVPATGTTNNGKFLKAGSTSGNISWSAISISDISNLQSSLNAKANSSDVYTKTEVDTKVNVKANSTDVYTRTEIDNKVNAKADKTNVYTKSEVDNKVNVKANSIDVYTKSQVDGKLDAKANTSSVYTKGEVDTKVNSKVSISLSETEPTGVDFWFEEL